MLACVPIEGRRAMRRFIVAAIMLAAVIGPAGRAYANDPPTGVDDVASIDTRVSDSVTITPLTNDTDPDGDALHVKLITPTLPGVVLAADGQSVVFTPDHCEVASETFLYRPVDTSGAVGNKTQITVRINVGLGVACIQNLPAEVTYREGDVVTKDSGGIRVDRLSGRKAGAHFVTFTVADITTSPNDYQVLRYGFHWKHGSGYIRIRSLLDNRIEDTESLLITLPDVIVPDGNTQIVMKIRDATG
jgi:Bacterial Ig domain